MIEFPEHIVIPYKDGPLDLKHKVYIQEDVYLELERRYKILLDESEMNSLVVLAKKLTENAETEKK